MFTGGRSKTTRATAPSMVQRTPLDSPIGSPCSSVVALRSSLVGRLGADADQARPSPIFNWSVDDAPSTAMTWPLMKRAAGEHRNSTV